MKIPLWKISQSITKVKMYAAYIMSKCLEQFYYVHLDYITPRDLWKNGSDTQEEE